MDLNKKIVELYDKFYDNLSKYKGDCYKLKLDETEKLNITVNEQYIKKIFDKDGIIPLRKYNDEKKLILGCGNVTEKSASLNHWFKKTYEKHSHKDACTIDPRIHNNPTIVAKFGYDKIDVFPDGSFDEIVFEGFFFELQNWNDCELVIHELIRLLKDGGYVSMKNSSSYIKKLIKKEGILVGVDDKTVFKEDSCICEFIKFMSNKWKMWERYGRKCNPKCKFCE